MLGLRRRQQQLKGQEGREEQERQELLRLRRRRQEQQQKRERLAEHSVQDEFSLAKHRPIEDAAAGTGLNSLADLAVRQTAKQARTQGDGAADTAPGRAGEHMKETYLPHQALHPDLAGLLELPPTVAAGQSQALAHPPPARLLPQAQLLPQTPMTISVLHPDLQEFAASRPVLFAMVCSRARVVDPWGSHSDSSH